MLVKIKKLKINSEIYNISVILYNVKELLIEIEI